MDSMIRAYRISSARLMAIALFCSLLSARPLFAGSPHSDGTASIPGFLKEGTIEGEVRSYYMHRHFDRTGTQESLALGGYLKYETPRWHGLSAGIAGYTSQGLVCTNTKKDGAGLLAPGQHGYGVIGQAYLKADTEKNSVCLFRQSLDTPFLNPFDARMTPITFEAYTVESSLINKVTLTVSHVTKIKEWTDRKFRPMSEAAGFSGTSEPVTLAGAVLRPTENLHIQVWDYFCHEFMNVVYAQADISRKVCQNITASGSLQGMYQQDIGKALGGTFNTGMAGLLGTLTRKGFALTLGGTVTDDNHDIVNPWGSYPGYTSIMEEDNDLAGEKAWITGVSLDFETAGIKGLSAFINLTGTWTSDDGSFSSPAQRETDFTIDYHFQGNLTGLWLRARAAFVKQSLDTGGDDYQDYRVILNYRF